jgi:hypothetical protein
MCKCIAAGYSRITSLMHACMKLQNASNMYGVCRNWEFKLNTDVYTQIGRVHAAGSPPWCTPADSVSKTKPARPPVEMLLIDHSTVINMPE